MLLRFIKILLITLGVLSLVIGLVVKFLRWMDGYYFFIGGLVLLFLGNSIRRKK